MRSRFKNGKSFLGSRIASFVSIFSEFVFNQDILLPSYRSPGFSGRSFLFLGVPTLPRRASGDFEEERNLSREISDRFESVSSYFCDLRIDFLRKGFKRFSRKNFREWNLFSYADGSKEERSSKCRSSYTGQTRKFSFTERVLSVKENSTDFSPPSRLHHPTRVGQPSSTEDRRLYDKWEIRKFILGLESLVGDIILLFSHRYLTFPQILDTKR